MTPTLAEIADRTLGDESEIAPSLVQVVVDGVIEGVRKGRYAPGQRLISADLALDFGVSRAPVREALSVLAGEGIVELVPNRGAKIRTFGVGDMVEFLELTEALCVLGVRLACKRVGEPAVVEAITGAFQQVKAAWDERSTQRFVESLYDYHRVINSCSGNKFAARIYNQSYFTFFNKLVADLIPSNTWSNYILNYEMVHSALLSGDEHAAVATFSMHMQWLLRILRRDEIVAVPKQTKRTRATSAKSDGVTSKR